MRRNLVVHIRQGQERPDREGRALARGRYLDLDSPRSRQQADRLLPGGRPRQRIRNGLRGRSAVAARDARATLTTDGHRAYLQAVDEAFGIDVDYAMLVKLYGEAPKTDARHRQAVSIGARKDKITGNPGRDTASTSHVERSNLSFRMQMRRFTRLTNTRSKKFENHRHMVALYTAWHNFVRTNSAVRMPPAMAAGIAISPMTMDEIVGLIDTAGLPEKKIAVLIGREIQTETVPPGPLACGIGAALSNVAPALGPSCSGESHAVDGRYLAGLGDDAVDGGQGPRSNGRDRPHHTQQ